MSQSPLSIEFYFFRRVHFELKDGFSAETHPLDPTSQGPEVNITSDLGRHPDEPYRFRIDLSIAGGQANEDYPFVFEIDAVGFFRVIDSYPAEQVELLAQVNGSSILYSAAREYLANLTGRSGYPPILLQSVSFVPPPAQVESVEAELTREFRKPGFRKASIAKSPRKR